MVEGDGMWMVLDVKNLHSNHKNDRLWLITTRRCCSVSDEQRTSLVVCIGSCTM